MSFDRAQFRRLVDQRLRLYGLHSDAAVNLLLGTAAVESAFGTYLRQIRGPAVGAFQVEPATFDWLVSRYRDRFPVLAWRTCDDVEWDLSLAILMCRLRYLVVPVPLPEADDIEGMGWYWKRHYNTFAGKGTVAQFTRSYEEHVQ